MTVLEAIQRSSEFLTRKEVESPRLQAELLLGQVLGIPRMKLYLNFDRVLQPAEADAYRGLVQRRGQREPLQHILGTVNFHGLELAVSREVLIPRPETELLVEQAVAWIRTRAKGAAGEIGEGTPCVLKEAGPLEVLDFGTGSGCIAIAIAAACPAVKVRALDVSNAALEVARHNAARHRLTERIEFCEGAGFSALPANSQFDLVVSNPPYIATGEIETLQPEVRDHDPRVALDGGADGLDFYRTLAAEAAPRIRAGGRMMLEFGDGQSAALRALFEPGWHVEQIIPDYSGRDRILIARRLD
jgi:release factor glutamine methyltransferase